MTVAFVIAGKVAAEFIRSMALLGPAISFAVTLGLFVCSRFGTLRGDSLPRVGVLPGRGVSLSFSSVFIGCRTIKPLLGIVSITTRLLGVLRAFRPIIDLFTRASCLFAFIVRPLSPTTVLVPLVKSKVSGLLARASQLSRLRMRS